MKNAVLLILLLLTGMVNAQSPVDFNAYFHNQTLRIDYFHTGDAKSEDITLDRIYKQGTWAGNPANCIQPFELGMYRVSIMDIASNRVIFTKGYNSIFAEYQTIAPAIKGIKHTYHESVLIPCPKRPFLLVIEKRNRLNLLAPVYQQAIDPADYHIVQEQVGSKSDKVFPVVQHGDPHNNVDLVILAEGYTSEEMDKFRKDLKFYTDVFFSVEPYKSRQNQFNVTGIFSPSEESGTDEPRQGIYRNTRLGSSFNYFDLDRYCLADDNKSMRDVASKVPYDAIMIMVNRERYGGGGIYNLYSVFTTGVAWREYVFLHEFGHSFAGLADEYFSAPVAYVDFYTTGVEPLEPNVTALLNPAEVKWKHHLSPGIDVPTEWGKATYDSLVNRIGQLNAERDKVIETMKQQGEPAAAIEKATGEFNSSIGATNTALNDFFRNHPLRDKVGVFEGANYLSKGMYRPTLMSLMHKFEEDRLSYEKVNEEAIINTIRYYTGE